MMDVLKEFYVQQYVFTVRVSNTCLIPTYFLPWCRDSLKMHLDQYVKAHLKKEDVFLFRLMQSPGILVEKLNKPAVKNDFLEIVEPKHPMYAHFVAKETSGWWLQYTSLPQKNPFEVGEYLQFKLIVCGKLNLIWQHKDWIPLLKNWVNEGMGIPNVNFSLIDIEEPPVPTIHHEPAQHFPISIHHWQNTPPKNEVLIQLLSPTIIDTKNHSFTFYTCVNALLKRMLRLQFLYLHHDTWWKLNDVQEILDYHSGEKLLPQAEEVRTQYIHLKHQAYTYISQNVKKGRQKLPLEGYIGEVSFKDYKNVLGKYLPILEMGEYISIGEHINYGNGRMRCYG